MRKTKWFCRMAVIALITLCVAFLPGCIYDLLLAWAQSQSIDHGVADLCYSLEREGVRFRFRDKAERRKEDFFAIGLFEDQFEVPGGACLGWAYAAPTDEPGVYEKLFTPEELASLPAGPPYDASTWYVVRLDGELVVRISTVQPLEPGWLPDLVDQALTGFSCAVVDDRVRLGFQDTRCRCMADLLGIGLFDGDGQLLWWKSVSGVGTEGEYEVLFPCVDPEAEYWAVVVPIASRAMELGRDVMVVSEPQHAYLMEPSLTDLSCSLVGDDIRFFFRDEHAVGECTRDFDVVLARVDETHSVDFATEYVTPIVPGGTYVTLYPSSCMDYANAWKVVEIIRGEVVDRSSWQSLEPGALSVQPGP